MGDCLTKKTIEECIRDLVKPELKHDYEKEIGEILAMIEMEKSRMADEYYYHTRKAQLNAERLQAILECVADSIMLKGDR